MCALSCVELFTTPWTVSHQAPLSMGDSPGKNTGLGYYFHLQRIFPIQGLNLGLLHCRQILYQLSYKRKRESEIVQSCPTPRDPMDCSLPGPSVHGIFQSRIREWVAISFFRDLPHPGIDPGSPVLQADSLPSEQPGCQLTITI